MKVLNARGFINKVDRVVPGTDVEVFRKLCLAGKMNEKGFRFYQKNYGFLQQDWEHVQEVCNN